MLRAGKCPTNFVCNGVDIFLQREVSGVEKAKAGARDVAVYDGSLREWTADERLPLEVG